MRRCGGGEGRGEEDIAVTRIVGKKNEKMEVKRKK